MPSGPEGLHSPCRGRKALTFPDVGQELGCLEVVVRDPKFLPPRAVGMQSNEKGFLADWRNALGPNL